MFTVYKKLTTPETSPVLGPANAPSPSPNVTPREGPQTPPNQNQTHEPTSLLNMEPFSLCNYCCSSRNKPQSGNTVPENTVPENTVPLHPENTVTEQTTATMQPAKYEFGHATHYVYGVTSPRLLCEFETGTNP